MRTLQRAGAALLVLTVVGGLVACGDDDDAASTDTTEASGNDGGAAVGDNAAFCDAVIEFNTAVVEVDLDETSSEEDIKATGEGLIPLFATIVDNAPDDLADSAGKLNDTVTPLAEGDATAFNEDSTYESYTEFLGGAVKACDYASVKVTAKDYAFDAPATIKAGNVAFAFTNTSEGEEHEMVIIRRAAGVDLSFDELLALPEEEAQTKSEFVGFAFAPPGGEASTLANLTPGDYAMVCFVSVGGAEDGPPHFTQGMVHEFAVE